MKFYFSGVGGVGRNISFFVTACKRRLLSCHTNYVREALLWMDKYVEEDIACDTSIMLDSGAFTAWSLGQPMTLSTLAPIYQDIWTRYGSLFREMWFINLDVIPGTRTQHATEEQIEQAFVDSDANFHHLTQILGPRILPVYHQGESSQRLEECCSLSDYICISPKQTVSENMRVTWLESLAQRLPPKMRLHGLATTGVRTIAALPWHSVDSASWVVSGGLGVVVIPSGKWIKPVSVSDVSPRRKEMGKHVDNMTSFERSIVQEHAAQCGCTLAELREQHIARKYMNLLVTQNCAARVRPIKHTQQGLF